MGRRHNRRSSQDLKRMLLSPAGGRFLRPSDSFDEIVPGLLLGDCSTGLSTLLLKDLRVTHILNSAEGKNDDFYGGGGYVNTSGNYYERLNIKYMGIPALDTPSFYMRPYFNRAADFIHDALRSKNGKVLVYCQCGISRSATLVAAYLMIKKGMNVEDALGSIRMKRSIFPNQGFLSQLCDLDYELQRTGALTQNPVGPLDASQPIKDSLRSFTLNHPRDFADTNYFPFRPPHTKYGNPLSSTLFYDSPTRARSEERYDSRYNRSRSPSPYRGARSSSVLPDTTYYWDRPTRDDEKENILPIDKPVGASMLSTHDLSRPFQTSYSFSRSSPAPAPQPKFMPTDSSRVLAARYNYPTYDRSYTSTYSPSLHSTRYYSPVTSSYRSYTIPTYSSSRSFDAASYLGPVVRRTYEVYSPTGSSYYTYRRAPVSVTTSYALPTSVYLSPTLRYPSVWTRVIG